MTPSSISGVYELCIGTPDPLQDLLYWQQYGYELGALGSLTQLRQKGFTGCIPACVLCASTTKTPTTGSFGSCTGTSL